MKLYGYWRSSATWRVRIGLAHKGVAYETIPVHLVKDGGEQRSAAHQARNPLEQVPVLEVDGRFLAQSIAILEFIEQRYPYNPILPADPFDRARARQLAEMVNSGIQPLQNLFVLQTVKSFGQDDTAWARMFIERGLGAMERVAADSAGRFLVGDLPSIADICLVPQLYNARRNGVAVEAYPTLLRCEEAANQLPSFQAAHPDRQPDAPTNP